MILRNKFSCAKSVIKAKFLKRRIPLAISWAITDRCNYRCKYCYRWANHSEELTTKEAFSLIDELSNIGTKIVNICGGEPLIREDIGKIINYLKKKNISACLTSNGRLVPEKISQLKDLDFIKLSFDGPKDVHDFLRQDGSFQEVIEAIKITKQNGLRVKLNFTITTYNLDYIDYALEKAMEFDTKIKFQPVSNVHTVGRDIESLFPERQKLKQALKRLISIKKNNGYIVNSIAALEYLYKFPNKKINCFGGKLICCIAPNGDLFPCTVMRDKTKPFNFRQWGFKQAFLNLSTPECDSCICTNTLELNYLLDFNLRTLSNIKKLL